MNIWILDSQSGIKLLYKSFFRTNIDEFLVSGLLSAFNQFIMTEFHAPIESLEMGGFRWIYLLEPDYNLMFVAADTKNISTEKLKSKLNIIKESFINNYKQVWIKRGKTWTGDVNVFLPFLEDIENFYYDWGDAEIAAKIGDFFDLLGVFQHLFNLMYKIIGEKVSGKEQENIYERIEYIFETFKNREDIKDDLELKNINFSRDKGFSIIEINPYNCDPIIVRNNLINFIVETANIIREEIGVGLSLEYFREGKIFNYIFNNLKLLKDLYLNQFLLKLFLFI
ncbi:MAG: hypothetical protein ACFE8A_14255 [Candidatus Hodarchaeota archaeon]